MDARACQGDKCKNSMTMTDTAARVLGWRVWSGTTIGGVESNVVFCPACCGEAGVDETTHEAIGYDAQCDTCSARLSDEDEGPFTLADAEEWQDEHECEPSVTIIQPKRKVAVA